MTIWDRLPEYSLLINKQVVWNNNVTGFLTRIEIDGDDVWFVLKDSKAKITYCSAVCGVEELK